MSQLFIAFEGSNVRVAAEFLERLEAHGYTVSEPPKELRIDEVLYPRVLERRIRSSTGLLVLWGAAAATDHWIERIILYALRLKLPIVLIAVDETPPPILLVDIPVFAVSKLVGDFRPLLALLPPVEDDDLLLKLLTHDYIRERKKGIEQAHKQLKRGENLQRIRALLDDIARTDMIGSVREAAREALAGQEDSVSHHADPNSRHVFHARCGKGHITSFDRRIVCATNGSIVRAIHIRAGKELDQLYLQCGTCCEEMVVPCDCEGYR